jgi:DNA-directed RNA polymerase subunit N (RpoN/RPB10)
MIRILALIFLVATKRRDSGDSDREASCVQSSQTSEWHLNFQRSLPVTYLLSIKMIIPVRCFSCGKVCFSARGSVKPGLWLTRLQVVGDLWESYVKLLAEDVKEGYA